MKIVLCDKIPVSINPLGSLKIMNSTFIPQDTLDDFTTYQISHPITIFNQPIADNEPATLTIRASELAPRQPEIQAYLNWLVDCRAPLIAYYNAQLTHPSQPRADDDWYNSLEIDTANQTIIAMRYCG